MGFNDCDYVLKLSKMSGDEVNAHNMHFLGKLSNIILEFSCLTLMLIKVFIVSDWNSCYMTR